MIWIDTAQEDTDLLVGAGTTWRSMATSGLAGLCRPRHVYRKGDRSMVQEPLDWLDPASLGRIDY